jgi:hypothetical protein
MMPGDSALGSRLEIGRPATFKFSQICSFEQQMFVSHARHKWRLHEFAVAAACYALNELRRMSRIDWGFEAGRFDTTQIARERFCAEAGQTHEEIMLRHPTYIVRTENDKCHASLAAHIAVDRMPRCMNVRRAEPPCIAPRSDYNATASSPKPCPM